MNVSLFDTPGQERYKSIVETNYKKADSIILLYDITRKSTLEECKDYYNNNIKEKCKKMLK